MTTNNSRRTKIARMTLEVKKTVAEMFEDSDIRSGD